MIVVINEIFFVVSYVFDPDEGGIKSTGTRKMPPSSAWKSRAYCILSSYVCHPEERGILSVIS